MLKIRNWIMWGVLALGTCAVQLSYADDVDSLRSLFQNPIVERSVYAHNSLHGIAHNGAVGVNADYEAGKCSQWFIEMQRAGGDFIQSSIAGSADPTLMALGIKTIKWGFSKQKPDGSFAGSGNLYHSSSLFLDAALRATLLMKESDPTKYSATIKDFSKHIVKGMDYMIKMKKSGDKENKPFGHRNWVFAAINQMTAKLTGNSQWEKYAEEYVKAGLSFQKPDGNNPEKGGYDVSYQTLGVLYAEKWYVNSENAQLKKRVAKMIEKALKWEKTHISDTGEVEVGASTRIGEGHVGRGGGEKKVDVKSLVEAYAFAAGITGNAEYNQTADLVAHHYGF